MTFANGGAYCHHSSSLNYTYFWKPDANGELSDYLRTTDFAASGWIRIAGVYKTT